MRLTLRVWRQEGPHSPGRFESYQLSDVSEHMSFLEMLDVLNEKLITEDKSPIAFDHDCREGICGMCSLVINGTAHGQKATTTCQLHMRSFKDGDVITIEPFRAKAFPVVRDLSTDRSAFDRIIQSGGFISAKAGSAPDANEILISKPDSDAAFDAATCIGCGACVAACKNSSAMLFASAKVAHLAFVPQGQPERSRRVLNMVQKMDDEGFGGCTNTLECEAVCPKEISTDYIALLNREFLKAVWKP